MSSGLSNDDKAKIRQQFATGQVGRDALLEAESAAYHGQEHVHSMVLRTVTKC